MLSVGRERKKKGFERTLRCDFFFHAWIIKVIVIKQLVCHLWFVLNENYLSGSLTLSEVYR